MCSTMKRRYLALALGAALIALPVSMAAANGVDGNAHDSGYSPYTPPSDEGAGFDGNNYDNTPYTTYTPSGDLSGEDDTDPVRGSDLQIPCSETDPCAPTQ